MRTPLWKDRALAYPTTELTPAEHYDVVIVGAGFTGLITSILLARAGKKTLTVEARDIGAGASGATTAKATLLQGNRLSEMERAGGRELASAYLEGHQRGLAWLLGFCDERGIPAERLSAWTYASTESGVRDVEKEHETAQTLGLPTVLHSTVNAPFPVHGAVELPNQLQLDPVDLLSELARALVEAGGTLVDQARVIDIETREHHLWIETKQGVITADQTVLATATPILDHGRTTVQLHPQRSYLCSFEYDGDIPEGMLISVESPTRSLRTASVDSTRYLLVGGNGHRTGQAASTQAQLDEIVEWTVKHFPGVRLTHSWSAQDYHPISLVPMVTTLPWGDDRVHFAGGYSKWGLTGAPAAAKQVANLVLGKTHDPPFGDPSLWGKIKGTAKTLADAPAPVVKAVADAVRTDLDDPDDNDDQIHGGASGAESASARAGHVGNKPVGETEIDGLPCRVSLVCPHMGAILAWNDSEESWDCPLHGSRFEADGTLLEGPPTTDLTRLQ